MLKWKTLLPQNNREVLDRLSALDGHHIAVNHLSSCTLAEGRPSIACTHFPFEIVALEVFGTRITDMCLYNDYIDSHMTQCFHTSR